MLGMRAGYVVPFDELAAAMWDGEPPRSARNSVHVVLTHLRKAVAVTAGVQLRRCGDGYQLAADPDTVDVHRFRRLARAARGAQDPWSAVSAFDEALGLWRGPALAGAADSARAGQVRSGLAGERLAVLEDRAGALLRCGRQADVAEQLPGLLAEYPLREQLAGLLMVALYRCGQQAEALAVFRAMRARLAGELGIEPGPDLQHLHRRILAADPGLGVPPTARAPSPPPRVVPRQLPAAPLHFAGRAAELQALTRLVSRAGDAGGMVMISVIGGSAGVGKTALALHWAHQVAHRFPDGQLYVDLRGYGPSGTPVTPAGAICGFLEALGVPAGQAPGADEAKVGLYRSLLADKRMLIVLDNARDEQQVRPLLPGGPGCLVLVTSRGQLLGLAAAEGAHQISLGVFTPEEARELLAARLGAGLIAADSVAVAELTGQCAGLPLALSIVAARGATCSGLSVGALASELRDATSRLDALDAGDITTSVRSVFSWSCRRLSGPAARMFRLLGIHPGPNITAAAAASLAALPLAGARQALRELTGAHLVEEHAPGRFAFHDLLRAYAAEQATALEDPSGRTSAIHRVLDHYLHTALASDSWLCFAEHLAPAPPLSPGTAPEHVASREDALAWFTAEHQVLLRVISLAADHRFDAHAWQLPPALWRFFALRGHWDDWASTHRIALAATQRLGDQAAQALAHRNLGDAFLQLGSLKDAQAHLQQALNLYRRTSDPAGQAASHFSTARILKQQGDPRQALHHARHALHLYQAAGEQAGQAFALNATGRLHAQLGNHRLALTYCRKALGLHREVGNRFGEALTLDSLAYLRHQAGRHSQAIALYQQALTAYRDADERYYHAQTLIHLAETHRASGNSQSAQRAWRQATAILDDMHHLSGRADLNGLQAQVRQT